MHGTARDGEIDLIQRLQAAELHDDLIDREDRARARAGRGAHRRFRLAARLDARVRAHPVRPEGAHQLLEEADNAVGQVVHDEQDHHAEHRQLVVGDFLQHQ